MHIYMYIHICEYVYSCTWFICMYIYLHFYTCVCFCVCVAEALLPCQLKKVECKQFTNQHMCVCVWLCTYWLFSCHKSIILDGTSYQTNMCMSVCGCVCAWVGGCKRFTQWSQLNDSERKKFTTQQAKEHRKYIQVYRYLNISYIPIWIHIHIYICI